MGVIIKKKIQRNINNALKHLINSRKSDSKSQSSIIGFLKRCY